MAELRLGLIGFGSWTRQAYVPAVRRDGRARIVAAAAPSAATRRRIGEELGASVAVYASAAELLRAGGVDAVMAAVSEPAHEQVLRAALDARMPIMFEPPVAASRSRVPAMLELLAASTTLVHADLELSYLPVVVRAVELVRSGEVGRVLRASIDLSGAWHPPDADQLAVAHMLAPWYVDVLNRVIGARPRRVLSAPEPDRGSQQQLHALTLLDYGRATASFGVRLGAFASTEIELRVAGASGDLRVDVMNGELRVRSEVRGDWVSHRIPPVEPIAGWPGMHESVSAFLDAVSGAAPSPTDAACLIDHHAAGLAIETSRDLDGWAPVTRGPPRSRP